MRAIRSIVVVIVACIWIGVGYQFIELGSAAPAEPRIQLVQATPSAPKALDYRLLLQFDEGLFVLPAQSGLTRRRSSPLNRAARRPPASPRRLDRPVTPLAPASIPDILYTGFVRAEDDEPTAMLQYGGRTVFVRKGHGVGPFRLSGATPDSAWVVYRPSKTELALGIQL